MALNETEKLVAECIRMRFREAQALEYMKANDHEISRTHFYRVKGILEATKLKRLYEIAKFGFVDQHLTRIDNLELIEKLLWENYWLEKSPYKKAVILSKIAEVQPYLSAYYEATKEVMKNQPKEDPVDISNLGRATVTPNQA